VSVWAEGVWAPGVWADGVWDEGEVEPPVVQPPVVHVGALGRGRQRVYVEIRDGQVYEEGDEPVVKPVVPKKIKRRVPRAAPVPRVVEPLPSLPPVEMRALAPFMDALRRDHGPINVDLARAAQRLFEVLDEGDLETLLL
jgi:hypothetical protein